MKELIFYKASHPRRRAYGLIAEFAHDEASAKVYTLGNGRYLLHDEFWSKKVTFDAESDALASARAEDLWQEIEDAEIQRHEAEAFKEEALVQELMSEICTLDAEPPDIEEEEPYL